MLCGDNKLLTPLQYRQMSGRSGRRGYDNIGHVIFYAVPPRKIFRLLKSPLNSLRGTFPINTTLTLKMSDLLRAVPRQETRRARRSYPLFANRSSATRMLMRICCRRSTTTSATRSTTCIGARSSPTVRSANGLSVLVSFMHAADPSNYGFVALLESGYLHKLCAAYDTNKNSVAKELLTLLAHLFYRVPLPANATRADFRSDSTNSIPAAAAGSGRARHHCHAQSRHHAAVH